MLEFMILFRSCVIGIKESKESMIFLLFRFNPANDVIFIKFRAKEFVNFIVDQIFANSIQPATKRVIPSPIKTEKVVNEIIIINFL